MIKKSDTGINVAPLRPLDDFLLEAARFQIPNFKDLDKWGNRVTSNLLYYQTNYFLMAFCLFVLVGILHPVKMLCGSLAVFLIIGIFIYVTNEKVAAANFKQNHPFISLLCIFGTMYFVAYMFQSLLVFFLGMLLPFVAIFIHASLRLRNIKNKFTNQVEMLGLKKSPMGFFLEEMGLEKDIF